MFKWLKEMEYQLYKITHGFYSDKSPHEKILNLAESVLELKHLDSNLESTWIEIVNDPKRTKYIIEMASWLIKGNKCRFFVELLEEQALDKIKKVDK